MPRSTLVSRVPGKTLLLAIALSLLGTPTAPAAETNYDANQLFERYLAKASAELSPLPPDIDRFMAEVDLCGVYALRPAKTNEGRAFIREILSDAEHFNTSEIHSDLWFLVRHALDLDS